MHSVKNSPLYLKGNTQGWPRPEYTRHEDGDTGEMGELVSIKTRVIRPGVTECEDVARPLPAPDTTIIIAAAVCLARVKSQLSCVCPLPLQSRVRS